MEVKRVNSIIYIKVDVKNNFISKKDTAKIFKVWLKNKGLVLITIIDIDSGKAKEQGLSFASFVNSKNIKL